MLVKILVIPHRWLLVILVKTSFPKDNSLFSFSQKYWHRGIFSRPARYFTFFYLRLSHLKIEYINMKKLPWFSTPMPFLFIDELFTAHYLRELEKTWRRFALNFAKRWGVLQEIDSTIKYGLASALESFGSTCWASSWEGISPIRSLDKACGAFRPIFLALNWFTTRGSRSWGFTAGGSSWQPWY